MPRRWSSCLILLLALLSAPAPAAAPQITLLYDTEFGGYVPVLGGIERPDLVVRAGDGRVPEKPRVSLRRAKQGARRGLTPVVPGSAAPDPADKARKMTRRWLKRTAVSTEILALDEDGRPLEGARVYRYYDPWFYGVNQDQSGARLFGAWRYMPAPNPVDKVLATIAAHEDYWSATGFSAVAEFTPNIDEACNPFVRYGPSTAPGLEYLGRTGSDGLFHAVTGVFNLRDKRRFPRTVVPSALRIGFVISADGYLPSSTEKRFASGGTVESRTVQLLKAPGWGLFTSGEWGVARRLVEAMPLESKTAEDLDAQIERRLDRLEIPFAYVPNENKDDVRREAKARLWAILARRGPDALRIAAARKVAELTPDASSEPARRYQLATLLLATERVKPGDPAPPKSVPPPPALSEAEKILADLIHVAPQFLPTYPLLDQLLVRRGASLVERREWIVQLLRVDPFEPWARARMVVFMLNAGRNADAFDHLRYTYMAIPGIGGDRELALSLSGFYWKIGLPEKAGAYAWLLTGRAPEDPFARPKGLGS